PLEERKRLCDPPNLPNLISFICLFTINMQPLALFLRKEPGGLSSISAKRPVHTGLFAVRMPLMASVTGPSQRNSPFLPAPDPDGERTPGRDGRLQRCGLPRAESGGWIGGRLGEADVPPPPVGKRPDPLAESTGGDSTPEAVSGGSIAPGLPPGPPALPGGWAFPDRFGRSG